MDEQISPAKKLHTIFKQIADHGQDSYIPGLPMSDVWINALNIPQSRLHDSLLETMDLIFRLEGLLRQNNVARRDAHLERLQRVKRTIIRLNSIPWGDFRGEFGDDFVALLELLDDDATDLWGDAPLSDGDLEVLQSEVERLIHDVVESQLSDGLKRVVLDGLEAVRDAIMQYRVGGPEGLRQALDRNAALVAPYRTEFEEMREDDHSGLWDRWYDLFCRMDGLVSRGLKIKQLAQPVFDRLMLNGGG